MTRNIVWLAVIVAVGLIGWLAFGLVIGLIAAAITLAISEVFERWASPGLPTCAGCERKGLRRT